MSESRNPKTADLLFPLLVIGFGVGLAIFERESCWLWIAFAAIAIGVLSLVAALRERREGS